MKTFLYYRKSDIFWLQHSRDSDTYLDAYPYPQNSGRINALMRAQSTNSFSNNHRRNDMEIDGVQRVKQNTPDPENQVLK